MVNGGFTILFRNPRNGERVAAAVPAAAVAGCPVGGQSRVHVWDLHRTFSTQPFILNALPVTAPEPL